MEEKLEEKIQTKKIEDIKKEMIKEQRTLRVRQFFHNKSIVIGVLVVLILTIIAVFADQIAPYDPYTLDIVNKIKGPSAAHISGNGYIWT